MLIGRNASAGEQIIDRLKAASVTTRPFIANFVEADLGCEYWCLS